MDFSQHPLNNILPVSVKHPLMQLFTILSSLVVFLEETSWSERVSLREQEPNGPSDSEKVSEGQSSPQLHQSELS